MTISVFFVPPKKLFNSSTPLETTAFFVLPFFSFLFQKLGNRVEWGRFRTYQGTEKRGRERKNFLMENGGRVYVQYIARNRWVLRRRIGGKREEEEVEEGKDKEIGSRKCAHISAVRYIGKCSMATPPIKIWKSFDNFRLHTLTMVSLFLDHSKKRPFYKNWECVRRNQPFPSARNNRLSSVVEFVLRACLGSPKKNIKKN